MKTSSFLVFFMAFIFFGCSSDDTSAPILEGSYTLEKFNVTNCSDQVVQPLIESENSSISYPETGRDSVTTVEAVFNNGTYSELYTLVTDGAVVVDAAPLYAGSYSQSGSILTMDRTFFVFDEPRQLEWTVEDFVGVIRLNSEPNENGCRINMVLRKN